METLRKRFTSLFFISMLMISILSAAGNTFPVQAQDTPDKTPITFYNLTKVSPNQEYIVSVSADDLKMTGSSIWLGEPFEADSTILASGDLLNGNYWVTNPIWSPESDQVAYLKVFDSALEKESNAPRFELWAIGIDKTNDRLLTNDIRLNPALGLAGQTYLAWTAPNEIEFLDSQALPVKKYTLNTDTLEIKESGELNEAEIQGLTATFNKLTPTNGATVTADTMPYYFLTWDVVADSKYEYCIDLTNDNNCDDGNWISRTAPYVTSLDMTFLEGGKTYYWQVRTKADSPVYANGGTWWNFKFNQGHPGPFVKIEPINFATRNALPVVLKWGASVGAERYKYCVDLLPCTPSTLTTTATTVEWSPAAGEPAGGIATYYWQVAAINSTGQTVADGGATGIFILNIRPGAFGKTAPVNNAQTSVKPTLSWEKSDRATSYEYCVSETQICASGWVNAGNETNIVVSPALTAPKTYYWQVRAKYSGVTLEANAGSWWSFTTVPAPGAFNKTSPTDAASGQSLSPTLSWEASDGATSYEYCYSSAPGPCSNWNPVGTNMSVTLTDLAAGYTYYWQARAVNPGGPTDANAATWWSFTTTDTSACTWPAYTAPASPTFTDVPMEAGYWSWVERLANSTITAGCGAGNYCPFSDVNRAQMAIFLLRAKHCGDSYIPPAVGLSTGFGDVPLTASYAPWVKQLAAEGITTGCGGGNFCPLQNVNRAQMAIFLLRVRHGSTYSPPAVAASTGFDDVSVAVSYAPWVVQLAAEGISAGCGGGNFCPLQSVNRAQMAIFLVRAFGLP
jgi:hypothetical protein